MFFPHSLVFLRKATRWLLVTALGAAPLAAVTAQAPPAAAPAKPPKLWRGTAQANASVFFGNTQQQVLGGHATIARVDSSLGINGDFQGLYGEAALDTTPRAVTKRLWLGTATVNFKPLALVSSFVTGTFESNLEKRIAERISMGFGAQWAVLRDSATQADLSVSLSGERTVARDSTVSFPNERLVRWSWQAAYKHRFDDHLHFSHVTAWRPSASDATQFLVLSTSELDYRLNGTVGVSLTFVDNYDSGALSRGARTYNDGQMLFGVTAGW
ncbi:MAG TPA: DUF481 domain-containing protein [Gemmatimonadaceae bacterium]|jgi:hypothetical protein|nr:DUF481 domain-containing protein [Gemmatimonadaceae bacterium]